MKITDLRATPVNIPFTAPYRFSYGSIASLTKTVVEVVTGDGITGLGEVADGDRAADVLKLKERLVGLDIREITTAENRCVPANRYTPWGNIQGARRAFGGVEMAMWDARGKSEGLSLSALLGGAVRDEIALTEYFSFRLPGAAEPGEATPLEVARYCGRMRETHGSTVFEGKVATVALADEIAMVRETRAAIGPDCRLQLDANGGWTLPTARDAIHRLAAFDITWYEEPVETYEEMAALRPLTAAGFSTHVVDLPKAVRLGCPDTIVTNIVELGGIRRTVEFIRMCEHFDVGFRFHSGETGIATAAYLQVSAAMEHLRQPSQTLVRWYADDVIDGGPFRLEGGVVPVPSGPGLGVTLDRKALARCHQRYLDEGAFPAGKGGQAHGGRFRKF